METVGDSEAVVDVEAVGDAAVEDELVASVAAVAPGAAAAASTRLTSCGNSSRQRGIEKGQRG